MKLPFLSFIVCNLIASHYNAMSQAGTLDPTFGTSGIASLPVGYGSSLAIQQDGRIILGGGNGGIFLLARFYPNGVIDSTFGDDGIAQVITGLGLNQNESIGLNAEGMIMMGGTSLNNSGEWNMALARFNSDGTLDESFGDNGEVLTSSIVDGTTISGYAIAVQADGKTLQVGRGLLNLGGQGFAVIRINNDGSLDNVFGNGGGVIEPIGNPNPGALCALVQADGKILMGGYSYSVPAPSCFALMRLNANGTLDNSFSDDGKVTTYFGGGGSSGSSFDADVYYAMALQPDGKILMTGIAALGANPDVYVPIVRYNTDGSYDQSFGSGGKLLTTIPGFEEATAYGITVQNDGKIITAGECSNDVFHDKTIFFTRHLPDGKLDSTFGEGGITIMKPDSLTDNTVRDVIMQEDQKILAAGWFGTGAKVMRLLSGLEVGISDPNLANDYGIFPNPTSTTIHLQLPSTPTTITLFNLLGEKVGEEKVSGGEVTMNVSDLPAGMYVVRAKETLMGKFVKE